MARVERSAATIHSAQDRALFLIVRERNRQDILKDAGRFEFTCADDGLTNAEKLACLTEELGEVAQEVLVGTREALRKELTQVAAVALAWIEALL